jgi:hypothetical protein
MDHARTAETEKDVQESILNFFLQLKQAYAVWRNLFDPDRLWDKNLPKNRLITTPIYYISLAGLQYTVEMLLKKGADVNAQGGLYSNTLQATSAGGRKATVQLLLEKGAYVNIQGGLYHIW